MAVLIFRHIITTYSSCHSCGGHLPWFFNEGITLSRIRKWCLHGSETALVVRLALFVDISPSCEIPSKICTRLRKRAALLSEISAVHYPRFSPGRRACKFPCKSEVKFSSTTKVGSSPYKHPLNGLTEEHRKKKSDVEGLNGQVQQFFMY